MKSRRKLNLVNPNSQNGVELCRSAHCAEIIERPE